VGDTYAKNGNRSRRPDSDTSLTRYRPGFFADFTASNSVGKAFLPSFHVNDNSQNVASLKKPARVRVAFVVSMSSSKGMRAATTESRQNGDAMQPDMEQIYG
jgi:hypothetical protein